MGEAVAVLDGLQSDEHAITHGGFFLRAKAGAQPRRFVSMPREISAESRHYAMIRECSCRPWNGEGAPSRPNSPEAPANTS
jgi:hypothetical protein